MQIIIKVGGHCFYILRYVRTTENVIVVSHITSIDLGFRTVAEAKVSLFNIKIA